MTMVWTCRVQGVRCSVSVGGRATAVDKGCVCTRLEPSDNDRPDFDWSQEPWPGDWQRLVQGQVGGPMMDLT
jgi:hypothetical protein